mmetsp:Transcript_40392/g.94902  ORF Transcript_40392/g.94902 Transcript_40392/m.94902 type:complete len:80 (+) Transcript_40392:529-768(+)
MQFPSTETFIIESFSTSDSFMDGVLNNIKERLTALKPLDGRLPYNILDPDGLQHPYFSRYYAFVEGKRQRQKIGTIVSV